MKKLFERLFGKKYWLVTYGRSQMGDFVTVSDTIFHSRAEAEDKFRELKFTRSIDPIEVVSFRSRKEY